MLLTISVCVAQNELGLCWAFSCQGWQALSFRCVYVTRNARVGIRNTNSQVKATGAKSGFTGIHLTAL